MKIDSVVGPYVVRRHLGDGGMGSVWLADDTRLHRRVALKVLRAARREDTVGRTRLMREARAAAAINHPHIATVYDVIEVDGDIAIVLEYVEGETLRSAIAAGPLPIERVLDVGIQLTKAIVAAHAQGVVHRDLKPANVIITPDAQVKVLDFGIARLLHLDTTLTAGSDTIGGPGLLGTPAYAAPEQMLSSAVDERADLYALGVILFELASGRRPFAGNDAVSLTTAKLSEVAPTLSSVGVDAPVPFESLVASLLERDPARRLSSAAEVLGTLRALAGTPTTGTLPAPRTHVVRWVTAAAVLSAVSVIAVVGLMSSRLRDAAPSTPPVVAVLPLRNTTPDTSKDFLAAGLSESLIASLASSPALMVLSRAVVANAVSGAGDTSSAINGLGAEYVVDGSLQQSGDQLRVAINVVQGNRSIWGGTFDGTIARVFDLQTQMALAVSEALSIRPGAQPAPAAANTKALEAYWKGHAFLDRWDVKGNVDAAISAFNEAVADDPKSSLAHAGLGLAYWRKYMETRDTESARASFESGTRAAALDPKRPEVRYALAVSLAGTGRRDEAVAELRQALVLRPTFDDARRKLGEVLAQQGKIDEAVGEFQRAIAMRPRFWGGYSDLGLALLNAARYAEAAKAFEQVVALQPDSYMGFQQLGSVYQMLGDAPKAIAAYEKSLAIRPSVGAYSNIGMLHHVNGDYARAVAAYQQAVALRPNFAGAHRNLGDAFQKMGRQEEARRAYLLAVERAEADLSVNPTNARTMAALAVYLVKAGRTTEALGRMAAALRIAPEDVQVRYRAAVVNSLAARPDAALEEIAAAIERGYSVRAVQEEEDFTALRGMPRFQQLTNQRRER